MRFFQNPKTVYYIKRILPFGIIWLVLSWFILLIESMATEYKNVRPETDITVTWDVFLFASLAVFVVGLAVGTLEVFWLGKLFKSKGFGQKILYKMGFYLLFMLAINLIAYPIAASIELKTSLWDSEVWQKFSNYSTSPTFLSTMASLAFSIFVSLLYSGISEHLGHDVLLNFFSGKYHRPKEESRIFMFLDMRSSTSLAEQLGHKQYFRFLRDYYNQLSNAIIKHNGEVYQYIGDEIVITWKQDKGLSKQNCVRCFYAMKDNLNKKSAFFIKTYGVVPSFRAGLHVGKVTTGEIGALKKEIFFTGDVLNVTARIQKLCKSLDQELLISGELKKLLEPSTPFGFESLGTMDLEGRKTQASLYAVKHFG
ncbi:MULTISPECIES: adenylate/guanylate cyclase domain-containing protein [Flavobacteriaceae]|uniref:adenylate/guanylate cyclase domain-containing protein n=1 Tax=Flavobacteriaceae TaxID=49546 RepID=UPI00234A713D|nr:adenylate/guanylate cyclase domain-containing protein [Muricauda sp. SP22]MDC6361492.1 adenylate/guanylate cyclase domain-containing protein [Muricauda sp. SP22]